MPDQDALRKHILDLLRGGHAHVTLDEAVDEFPLEHAGVRPSGSPHSVWELLEHIRISTNDILCFSQSPDYESPPWPKGYWPNSPAPRDQEQWDATLGAIRRDLAGFETLVQDPANDLLRPLPWGEGQTLMREALLIADHNAYHLGQLVLVRRLLGAWD